MQLKVFTQCETNLECVCPYIPEKRLTVLTLNETDLFDPERAHVEVSEAVGVVEPDVDAPVAPVRVVPVLLTLLL